MACNLCIQENEGRRPPQEVCNGCWFVSVENMDELELKNPRVSVRARSVGLITADDIRARGEGKVISQI